MDRQTTRIQSVTATAADATVWPPLWHGDAPRVDGDHAYRGQTAVIRHPAPWARDFTTRRDRHGGSVEESDRGKHRTKANVRAKVEHALGVLKRIVGVTTVRARGLYKNPPRVHGTGALANLFLVRRRLLPTAGSPAARVAVAGDPPLVGGRK